MQWRFGSVLFEAGALSDAQLREAAVLLAHLNETWFGYRSGDPGARCRGSRAPALTRNDELIATIPGFTPRSGSTVEATDFERPDGVFLLALSNDGPVGCGGLRRIAPGIAEVKRLYVRSRARSRGTGRALLQHLEKHAHELGFTKVRWTPPAANRPR